MGDQSHLGASRKTPLTVDAAPLDGASRRAWTAAMAVRPFGDAYLVEDARGTHFVSLGEGRCSCGAPDDERCKHRRRVAIEINLGHVPPPTGRSVPCQGCRADVTVSVADDPPHLCEGCALSPGDLVVDSTEEGETPLLVVSRPGPPASAVVVPDADCTVADYPGNDAFPADAPVVEVVYPRSVTTERPPRRYLFPVPRLERPTTDEDQTVLAGPPGVARVDGRGAHPPRLEPRG